MFLNRFTPAVTEPTLPKTLDVMLAPTILPLSYGKEKPTDDDSKDTVPVPT